MRRWASSDFCRNCAASKQSPPATPTASSCSPAARRGFPTRSSLLASGYGKRLLISGVHPTNGVSDISRSLPDSQPLLKCCVDLDRSAVNTRSNASETRRWVDERGFHSLIVVTSNYHMPRAIVELSHAMPDITLIPFAVVGDKWREEPWWTSGATLRLLLSEYVKYIAAEVRVRLAYLGLELAPEIGDQPTGSIAPRKPATAQAR